MIVRALALTGALCAAAPAAAQQTVTKAEVRSQKPSVTDAQLRNQLWGMFHKEDRRTRKTPARPLEDVWLDTPAYPTKVPDLCRSDRVTMRLAPADPREAEPDADTPMRAYGLDSEKRFLFLALPAEEAPEQEEDAPGKRRDMWHGACSRLDRYDARFFRADDEKLAMGGYRALLRAARVVQAGEAKIRCNLSQIEKRPCAEVLGEFAKAPISSIESCPAVTGLACYSIFGSGDLQVRVTIVDDPDSYKRAGGEALPMGRLMSVDVDEMIILWHTRPD